MKIKAFIFFAFFCATSAHAAVLMNGTSDFIRVPDSASLTPSTSRLTISCWVNFTFQAIEGIVAKRIGTASSEEYLLFYRNDAGDTLALGKGFYFRAQNVQGVAGFGIDVALNTWYHVVATYSGATGMVYVNGVAGSAGASSTAITDGAGALSIGCLTPSTGASPFSGSIDDVRIYNRVLSLSEIQSLYASRTRLPLSNSTINRDTMAWWKIDEGSPGQKVNGATFYDSSGNGNHAIANDGTSTTIRMTPSILRYP